MRLKMLEIQGFKSFPDKSKLTFNQDITAVIGPNGSGKSNISDAIRWVLGEQSNKQLRGKKMEDVIFGGTKLRKPLGFAEVTITLDNADRGLSFDSDEVSVTRRYYRSGESEYKINGASVRLKDVNELFMDTGLGRDGYSMIGQGRIDEIVGSKSDERRDIFEEAAGISRFRYRKLDAQRQLDKAEENMLRLRDILEELESRVGPLKTQSEKAQKFLTLSAEKKDLEIGLWLHTIDKSKDDLREHEQKLEIAQAHYDKLGRELATLEAQGEINSRDIQSITVQIDSIRRESDKTNEQSAQTKSEIAVLDNTILHNNETIERLRRDVQLASSSDEAVNASINDKNEQIAQLEKTIAEKTVTLNDKSAQLASLSDDAGDFSQQIEDKNSRLNALSAKLTENRVKLVTANDSLNELERREAEFDNDYKLLSENAKRAGDELEKLKTDLARCDEQIAECQNIVNGFKLKLEKRAEKLNGKREICDKLKLDVGETERRIRILEDLERNMEGFSYAVKAVSKQKERGTLRGIHGPVSRLITVPQNYATAIEIALGAAAQNIVVSTEDDAKRAINYLKTSNSGRATFLPISSIKPNFLREQGVENCIGFVGIAADLVTYDKQYEAIVQSLLGRTVIAEDMDSAVALAKRYSYRFRTVTLDGQVVNAGGSLTGGSHVKNAGILSRASQIEKLNQKLSDTKNKYDTAAAELKALNEEAARMNAQISAAAAELQTANEDKIRVQGEIRLFSEQFKTANDALNGLQNQKKNSLQRKAAYKTAADDAQAEINRAQTQIDDIEQDLQSLSGGRDKLAERRNQLSEQIGALNLEIIGCKKDVENLNDSILQLEASKTDKSEQIKRLESEIEEIGGKNAEIVKQIEQLRLMEDGLLKNNADAASEIEKLNIKREQLEKESYEARAKERDKQSDREKISGEVARLTERKNTLEEEYNIIISKLFDEYELTLSAAQEIAVIPEDIPSANKRLNDLKRGIRALGSVNVAAIEEYKEVAQRYEFMKTQLDDIEKSKRELTKLISELTDTMKSMFISQFGIIAANFTEVFKELFGGGTAELRLTDPEDVLESGIDIIAQPPGKSIAIIEQLSGGEKALIAVSIYFAIMKVNPPPFCLLDEVEAALDDVNVDRFAQYLRRMSGVTQFIVITHRRGTMEEADVLYGVTMQEKGVSKLLSIDVTQIEQTLKTEVNR